MGRRGGMESSGETWAKKTIVGSGEEERGTESGFGDAVALGVGQALDYAVQAQAAELIGHGAGPRLCGSRPQRSARWRRRSALRKPVGSFANLDTQITASIQQLALAG